MTKALIDGDILVYSVGFSTEDESEEAAILKMDSRIDEITFNCGHLTMWYISQAVATSVSKFFQAIKRIGSSLSRSITKLFGTISSM